MHKKFIKMFLFVAVIPVIGFFYFILNFAQSADYTFTQTNWSGGQIENIADHTNNQMGWDKFSTSHNVDTTTNNQAVISLMPHEAVITETFSQATYKDSALTTATWNTTTGQLISPAGVDGAEDLSAKINSIMGTDSSIASGVYGNKVYIGSSGGKFLVYDTATRTATNLTSKISSFFSTNAINDLGVDTDRGIIYLCGDGGKFAKYTVDTDTVTDLTSKISSFWGTNYVYNCAVDRTNNVIYIVGEAGKFAKYTTSTDTATNLTSKISAFWSTYVINNVDVDPVNQVVYLSGNQGKFAKYTTSTDTATNLTSKISAFWSTNTINAGTIDPINGVVYFGGIGGLFAKYTISTDTATNLTSKISAFWSTNRVVALIPDVVGGEVYLGGVAGNFAKYTLATDSATNLTSKISPFWTSSYSVGDLAHNVSSDEIYLVGSSSHFAMYDPTRTYYGYSTTIDITDSNILSATLTKNDTADSGVIAYYLSNDGGANWQQAIPGSEVNFSTGGSDLRFKISLTNGASVQDITIAYTYEVDGVMGELTSNSYNTQNSSTTLSKIQWTETLPQNTDVQFQLRTSPDGANWTNWCGPDDNMQGSCDQTTFFTDPTGNETIDDIHRDRQDDQFIQYKVYLSTTDGLNTPMLSSVSLSYDDLAYPQITTQNASDITDTAAMLNANLSSTGNTSTQRTIEWGTESGNYTNLCNAGEGEVGTYSCNLTNLTPDTTYYYRAKATNAIGTSYAAEMQFTTQLPFHVTIVDPSTVKITDALNSRYLEVIAGTPGDALQARTNTTVTFQFGNTQATFSPYTTIMGDGNFNFQQFTLTPTNVHDEQSTSRVALHLGIPNESLTFSQPITMQIYVGTIFNDHQMEVLYQNDNESDWHHHTYCTIANGYCTFTTTHATIYTVNGNHQTTGDTPMNLNVEIQETLSMDCFDPSDSNTTVSLGTSTNPGLITAGTPAVGQSRCTVTTNADQGYYLTLTNANPTNTTLTHTDPHTGTIYEIQDATAWNETTKTTNNWISPTTKGLAFSVITFPEADTTHNQFNGVWNQTNQCPEGSNPDTNDYAGIPTTPQAISAVTSYQSAATTTNICYKVDVPTSQPSGQYSGQVMFTATSDASGYWE